MLRHFAALSLITTLAACGGDEPPRADATPLADAPAPMPETPPAPEPARYVGRWAAIADLCRDGAWTFGEHDLSTAGEVSCTFSRVTPTADGYEIDADCQSEGAPAEGRLTVGFPPSAGRMTVRGGPYGWDVGLVRCEGA